ncbi:MAG: AI-2E family transporter [Aeromonadales bacterium]|nr:AI-2E family transporter [Aeromonadales bacterium]MDY2891560.1 AI-2E family transporter [Succinivibrio sp.]
MIEIFRKWYRRNFSVPGTAEFALLLIACFACVYWFMWLFGPVVVALCMAYCLDWFVRLLERRLRMGRRLAAAATMVVFIGVAAGIVVFVAPRIVNQGTQFYSNMVLYSQDTVQKARQEAQEAREQAGADGTPADAREQSEIAADALDGVLADKLYTFIEPLPDPWPTMLSQTALQNYIHSLRIMLMSNLASILKNQVMPSVVNVMSWTVYAIIVPIFMFLMLANKEMLQRRVRRYVMPRNSAVIDDFWPKINSQLESYINGSLLHIAISACANGLLFWAFGLNYAVLLGVAMGFSVVIPYVGAVLVGIPVVLIAAVQFGLSAYLGWFFAAYILLQLLDSYALTPVLFSKTMDLDAFSILLAIMVFGTLWGFWGVFFSIPLARFIDTLISQWPRVHSNHGHHGRQERRAEGPRGGGQGSRSRIQRQQGRP